MANDDDDESHATTTPTDAPRVGPTMVPHFDFEAFARDSWFQDVPSLFSETVLEVVSDVSWSEARLDLGEIEVMHHLDGMSPVTLLESLVGGPREELHATLVTLLARGFIRIADEDVKSVPRTSAIRPRMATANDDTSSAEDDADIARAR